MTDKDNELTIKDLADLDWQRMEADVVARIRGLHMIVDSMAKQETNTQAADLLARSLIARCLIAPKLILLSKFVENIKIKVDEGDTPLCPTESKKTPG